MSSYIISATSKVKSLYEEIKNHWHTPARGNYVPYKEYAMLSIGWLGMRLGAIFGIGFGVGNAFTGMTLHMNNKDLLIMGYVCTAIGYLLAPLNAYIIDNFRHADGKYRVFIKLAIPSGILSLFALFFPYENLGYTQMVISLFLIGQIQGYVQLWYTTGVSNLVHVISPNSKERVRIMTVTSLVHNFAPTITGLLLPIISDVFMDGDMYNIKTYRIAYPAFIIVGIIMSLAAYFGVKERIVQPRTRMTKVGFVDAFRAVSKNKLFWIKSVDSWNNFLEGAKSCLLQWVFYYGKVGSMTMYGILNTVTYNSSMWAMIASPALINKLGKRNFKLIKNIIQVFLIIGLSATYKKSVVLIAIFFFLDRFFETGEVIDRAIESDIRDYQQYVSGERIDGAFDVITTYVGGVIGAVTGLFLPWVYAKNGFDGTDYSVLYVFDNAGNYNPDNVLYTLLDVLLKFSLIGSILDIIPWFFYDLSETKQKSIIKVTTIRSAAEDKAAGVIDDGMYCEACEAIISASEYIHKEKQEVPKAKTKEDRLLKKQIKAENEQIEIAEFIYEELNRYNTEYGKAALELSRYIIQADINTYYKNYDSIIAMAKTLPKSSSKREKDLRSNAINNAKAVKRSKRIIEKYYPNGLVEYTAAEYEEAYNLPEETKEQRAFKRAEIKKANKKRDSYGKAVKPYLVAQRDITLYETYSNINEFMGDYEEAKERYEKTQEQNRKIAEYENSQRKEEAQQKRSRKNSLRGEKW